MKHGTRRLTQQGKRMVLELNVAKQYKPGDEPQLLNELKATGIKVGMLIVAECRKQSKA